VGEVARAYAQVGGGETNAVFIGHAADRIRAAAERDRTDPRSRQFLSGLVDRAAGATVTSLVGPTGRGGIALHGGAETDNEKEAS
jgi:hypothetical protein